MYTYALTTDQSARSSLDEFASTNGAEDASQSYPDHIEGDALKAHANSLVDQAFDENDDILTDDPEEYRARYVDAYCKAYAEQIQSMIA